MGFVPIFTISPTIADALMRIAASRQAIVDLPMTVEIQARLRETAKLVSTHLSTAIEGNRLTFQEAQAVIERAGQGQRARDPVRRRDEREVLGYYCGLEAVERLVASGARLTAVVIRTLHALVMGGGRTAVRPSAYRDGQNVIRDASTGAIVYLPPEAPDVPALMSDLVGWLEDSASELPCPMRAGLAHYQLMTIHPWYDGNGRTARLLTTLVLHLGGFDVKGFYSLEEYYAQDLASYYSALSVGPSHNYYFGRTVADLTAWLEYFCLGTARAFEHVQRRAKEAAASGAADDRAKLRQLDSRQRKVLALFRENATIMAKQVGELLGLQPRTARTLCQRWAVGGFLAMVDPARKSRKYGLGEEWQSLIG
ncbi:MAG: Fic family protein [Candidatus Schekmanbacteria bacterium]|nr:Fic family protein [Candidatus Schekmanbacteria bacterium]